MIFADTGYLLALFHRGYELHKRALAWSAVLSDAVLVTEYVLCECVDAFSAPANRPAARALIEFVRTADGIEIVPSSPHLFEAGWQLHRTRPDKAWSLTDCISFHVMQERGITSALAHDAHFVQAGFAALLREDPPGAESPS